ncbi:SusC/RagA family TonB-linked outer membrane protein [Maribacter polysiphoniae]|uniref:SusC/RagA family TonB-linked outer membrane protein n=1 Tax=Maribacter polysiphoniae TaxID=429344 RepID=A0A316E4K9_9FLAO|nr:SusC/RagA family TonB-linked outer membrane protein [Maribacter polysiphoniae]MBD1261116.1 SusC/RagA family TonB-linked outer membrane protein [Maribacter polysiphoniae]PWK23643.1 TonB-linked SusC/RagA family outer membrane protein [Maribacter polysiphoniae]
MKLKLFITLLILSITSYGQDIRGKVTDATNIPLPGVSIIIEGTTQGTTTDFDGNYSIKAQPENRLIFSYLGMKTQIIAVGSQKVINVGLQDDTTSLDEVVVTAFGNESQKKSITTAVQAIKSDQLQEGNQNNMVNGLQGKVSGVTVVNSGGAPGSSSVILIRGGTSITGDNQPLFVVDGIPIDNSTSSSLEVASTNRASDINPEDIESISVLKGPSAAALYGIQAANGAVIITTKRGKAGVSKISYSGSISVDQILGTPDVQTVYGQGKEIGTGSDITYDTESEFSWGGQIGTGTPLYDNIADLYQTAVTQNHNVSYSSGNEKGNMYFSIGDISQDGVIPTSSYDKTSFKVNMNSTFKENLTIGVSANYITTDVSSTRQGNASGGSFSSLLAYPSNVNAKDYLNEDGSQKQYFLDQQFDNPYWSFKNSPNTDEVNRLIGVISLNYRFLDDFNLSYKLGTDNYTEFNKKIIGDGSLIENREDGYISQFEKDHKRLTSNLFLRYDKQLSNDFSLNSMIGNSVEELDIRTNYSTGDGFQAPGIYSIGNVLVEKQKLSEIIARKRIVGLFGEIKLGWKDALFLTATGRNDWSSTLPENKRSFFYPSVGTSAVMTDLFKDLSSENGLNYLKLRASWAKVGKDAPIGALESFLKTNINGLASSAYTWNGVDVGNPDLEPEFTNSYEFGADMRFLNNRISLDLSYYYTKSDNQILRDIRVPPTTGTFYATLNGGVIENKGLEALLTARILESSNGFSWNTNFNFGMNKSKVLELPGFLNEVYLSDSWTYRNSAAGAAVLDGSLFGLRGKRPQLTDDGQVLIQSNGNYILEDATYDDVQRLPDWSLGITNSLSYKNLKLSFLLDIVQGQEIYNATESALAYYGLSTKTLDRGESVVLSGVDINGNTNQTAIVKNQEFYQNYYSLNSENFIEDGSFARLRYVTLSYKFPQPLLEKLSLASLELYATGRNLFTITNYSGVDPEINTFGAGISGAGSMYIDNLGTPSTQGFDLGLKFTF